jgi:O6-methylguanine-DNA--protein-cysteine methyltransferase
MARAPVQKIFCGKITIDDLHVYLASTRKGARRVSLRLEEETDCVLYFRRRFPHCAVVEDARATAPLREAVRAAVNGVRPDHRLVMDIPATPFQMKAWRTIARIPYGETRTYGEIAAALGKPKASRAVGQAMKKNPLPLIFP